jgi:hypothetical protein
MLKIQYDFASSLAVSSNAHKVGAGHNVPHQGVHANEDSRYSTVPSSATKHKT